MEGLGELTRSYLLSCDIAGCLSVLGFLYQDSMDWVAYKQEKCIAHSFGSWEVCDEADDRLDMEVLPGVPTW